MLNRTDMLNKTKQQTRSKTKKADKTQFTTDHPTDGATDGAFFLHSTESTESVPEYFLERGRVM